MTTPPWLNHAWDLLGQFEHSGSQANPKIAALFADAGHPKITSDETAWCAAFVGATLKRANVTPSGSLLARSYLTWGEPLAEPLPGAITVLSRSSDPASGHVGFLLAETTSSVILLGGNQSDGVTVAAFPKSRLLSYRWPHAPVAQTSDIFERALAHVLKMEGGYTNDPADPGGPTNFGITLSDYARHVGVDITPQSRDLLIARLKAIAPSTVHAIYERDYWLASGCPSLPAPIALFHFDCAVNMGVGTAIRMLQTALSVTVDGELGPQTVQAATRAAPQQILTIYADARRRRYQLLTGFPRFGRGWLARVDATLAAALQLSLAPNRPSKGSPTMSTLPTPNSAPSLEPKWWGHSLTIWGAVIAGLAAVVPAVGPAIGVEVSSETIIKTGDQVTAISQAVLGLVGTLAAIFGRVRATQPLMQRDITVKI
jgi:uncharacterized protein (TIGR02594 family)